MDYSFNSDYKSIEFVIKGLSSNSNLSDWEKGFVNDIKSYTNNGGFLSEKQLAVLSNLWEKY